jgi:chaperone modulatory protein CbpM
VKPLSEGEGYYFAEVDYARVRFICDMHYDLNIDEEALPILLGLLDQVYDLRRQMKAVGRAIETQPEEVQNAIAQALSDNR